MLVSMEFDLYRFGTLGSTMDTAREMTLRISSGPQGCRGQAGAPGNKKAFVVLADEQTAGRGRVPGRIWRGSAGSSLFMTLAIPSGSVLCGSPTLAVGLGLHEAVRESLATGSSSRDSGGKLLLKWPNDLVWVAPPDLEAAPGNQGKRAAGFDPAAPRKLAGILCESGSGWFFAGIGVNLTSGAYPDSLRDSAVSMGEILASRPGSGLPGSGMSGFGSGSFGPGEMEVFARSITGSVLTRLSIPLDKDEYESLMWGLDEEVSFLVGHPESGNLVRGNMCGIDSEGRLLVSKASGPPTAFSSGEIAGIRILQRTP